MARWVDRARAAGLDDRSIEALVREMLHGATPRGDRVTDLAIETNDLGKRYGKVWALQRLHACDPAGRVSGLVGPNGAGKTTLLRMLAGLEHADGRRRARRGPHAARRPRVPARESATSRRRFRCTGVGTPPTTSPWART